MNVNELTDLIVKITRSNKKQLYSKALANVINDEKGAPVFDTLDYVFNVGDDLPGFQKGKYRLGDIVKVVNKNGSGGYFPYYLLLSKELYDKFGREVLCIKDGLCFYTETLNDDSLGPITDHIREDPYFKDFVKDHYAIFAIIVPTLWLYNNNEDNGYSGVEQVIITYDGVLYKYDKNNVIIDEDELESALSFNLLNLEA